MPLIRYATNDLAGAAEHACPCGLPGRIIRSIDGRQEDYVILRSGARLGRMDHIFKDMVNIREAQILQAIPGEITLRIVRRDGFDDRDEQELLREAHKRVGEDTDIRVDYVQAIEREPNGKLRFVISELAGGSLERS
jgi:phenylacetate-CoA ligase